jgi:hypothetical protein
MKILGTEDKATRSLEMSGTTYSEMQRHSTEDRDT